MTDTVHQASKRVGETRKQAVAVFEIDPSFNRKIALNTADRYLGIHHQFGVLDEQFMVDAYQAVINT